MGAKKSKKTESLNGSSDGRAKQTRKMRMRKKSKKNMPENMNDSRPPNTIDNQPRGKESWTKTSTGLIAKGQHATKQLDKSPYLDEEAQAQTQEAEHTKALSQHVLYAAFNYTTKKEIDMGGKAETMDLVSPDVTIFELLVPFADNVKEQSRIVTKDYVRRVTKANPTYFESPDLLSIMKDYDVYLSSCGTMCRKAKIVLASMDDFKVACNNQLRRTLKNSVPSAAHAPYFQPSLPLPHVATTSLISEISAVDRKLERLLEKSLRVIETLNKRQASGVRLENPHIKQVHFEGEVSKVSDVRQLNTYHGTSSKSARNLSTFEGPDKASQWHIAVPSPKKKKVKKLRTENEHSDYSSDGLSYAKQKPAAALKGWGRKKKRQADECATAEAISRKKKTKKPFIEPETYESIDKQVEEECVKQLQPTCSGTDKRKKKKEVGFDETANEGATAQLRSGSVIELSLGKSRSKNIAALLADSEIKEQQVKELKQRIEELTHPRPCIYEDNETGQLAGLRTKNVLLEADLDALEYMNKRLWEDAQHVAKLREQNSKMRSDLEIAKEHVQQLGKARQSTPLVRNSKPSGERSNVLPDIEEEVTRLREYNLKLTCSHDAEKGKISELERRNASLDAKFNTMAEVVKEIAGLGRWIDVAAGNAIAGIKPLLPIPVPTALPPPALLEQPSTTNEESTATLLPPRPSRMPKQGVKQSRKSSCQKTKANDRVFKAPPSGSRGNHNWPDSSATQDPAAHTRGKRYSKSTKPPRNRQSFHPWYCQASQTHGFHPPSSHIHPPPGSHLPELFPNGFRHSLQPGSAGVLPKKETNVEQPSLYAPIKAESV